jgi:hypothetical protein
MRDGGEMPKDPLMDHETNYDSIMRIFSSSAIMIIMGLVGMGKLNALVNVINN